MNIFVCLGFFVFGVIITRYAIMFYKKYKAYKINEVYQDLVRLAYESDQVRENIKKDEDEMLTDSELTLISTILTIDKCIVSYLEKHPEAAHDESLRGAILLVGAMIDDLTPEERELIDLFMMKLVMQVMSEEDEEDV